MEEIIVKCRNKRDPGVEFARIIGSLVVIGCHVYLPRSIDGNIDTNRVLVSMFCADGVAVFWMLLGFFLFNNNSFLSLCIKTIKRIFIPIVIFSIFTFYFYPLICGEVRSFSEVFHKDTSEYIYVFRSVLCWMPAVNGSNHLWYLYIYMLVIVMYPALSGLVNYMGGNKSAKVAYLIIGFYIFAVNVLTGNKMMFFSHQTIGGLFPASIIVIYGHFLYKQKKFLERYGSLSIIIFIFINVIRTKIYILGFETIIYWYSISGMIGATCIIAFSMWFVSKIKNKRVYNVIYKISSYSFVIYLVQFYSIQIYNRLHFQIMLLDWLKGGKCFFSNLLYTVILSLAVFLLSLIIAIIIRALKRFAKEIVLNLFCGTKFGC